MSVPSEDVKRATDMAHQLEAQGYFAKAKAGDEKGASYFARMVASRVNPTGNSADWGWLKKTGSGFNVDGYADGAIIFGNDPSNRRNVLKIVTQIGSTDPNAIQIGDAVQEHRESDVWASPVPLPDALPAYLGGSPTPLPPPAPTVPPYAGDAFFTEKVGAPLHADYSAAGQLLNAGSATWFARTIYDIFAGMTPEASVTKHRNEWRGALGLPPL